MSLRELIARLDSSRKKKIEPELQYLERILETRESAEIQDLDTGPLRFVSVEERVRWLEAAIALTSVLRNDERQERSSLEFLIGLLIRRRLPLDKEHLSEILQLFTSLEQPEPKWLTAIVNAVEAFVKSGKLPAEWREQFARITAHIDSLEVKPSSSLVALRKKINQLCESSALNRLKPDEGWADLLVAEINAMDANVRALWLPLLQHASEVIPQPPATSWDVDLGALRTEVIDEDYWRRFHERQLDRRCATSWMEGMKSHVARVGEDEYRARLLRWLQAVPNSKPGYLARTSVNREMLRGLLWSAADVHDAALARAIGAACDYFYRKNSPLGVTGVTILARSDAENVIQELAVLSRRVKAQTQKSLIQAAIERVAARTGVSPRSVDDLAFPTGGLTEIGRGSVSFDEFSAEIAIVKDGVDLKWYGKGDKPQKSVPAQVKRNFATEFQALKHSVKEIETTLSTVARHLDEAPMVQRFWKFADWKERYQDHPVVATVARRLLWQFSNGSRHVAGMIDSDSIVDVNGAPITTDHETKVTLWHPMNQNSDQIARWRDRLFELQITQPFKQAHREIYLLTDAERATGIYSNRFASHILRQSQFRALAKSRNWKSGFLGPWDSYGDSNATRDYRDWNIRAEFWLDTAAPADGQGDMLYVATDQVRFRPLRDNTEPIPLTEVPPLVFSEAMRDVDLFVGVASVGNNPEWQDGGPNGTYRDYWQSYSFGDLSETAKTRRAVLERLVPRLKIADRCTFDGKFLVVRGELRSYKIHLGSGNILMTPNDQYLCIVPARGEALRSSKTIFLPFEGDTALSVILSKAFLLAEDDKIEDKSILSQIRK